MRPLTVARTGRNPRRLPGSARIEWSPALKSTIPKLRIHYLKAQLAKRQHVRASLIKEFEAESLSIKQRAVLAHCLGDAQRESHVLQLMLDLLERQKKQERKKFD